MSGNNIQAIGTSSANSAEQVKKYKERYNAMMEGVGSFGATISNVWQNMGSGNVDLSGVTIFGNKDNGTCAFNS